MNNQSPTERKNTLWEILALRLKVMTVWLGWVRIILSVLVLLHLTFLSAVGSPIMALVMLAMLFATLPDWLVAQDWFQRWSKVTKTLTLTVLYSGFIIGVTIGLSQAFGLSAILGFSPWWLMLGLMVLSIYKIWDGIESTPKNRQTTPEIMSKHRMVSETLGLIFTLVFVDYYVGGILPTMTLMMPWVLSLVVVGGVAVLALVAWSKYNHFRNMQPNVRASVHKVSQSFNNSVPPFEQLLPWLIAIAVSMILIILPGMGLIGWPLVTALIAAIICGAYVINVWRSFSKPTKLDVASIIGLASFPVVASFTAVYTLFMIQPVLLILGPLPAVAITVVVGLVALVWVRASVQTMRENITVAQKNTSTPSAQTVLTKIIRFIINLFVGLGKALMTGSRFMVDLFVGLGIACIRGMQSFGNQTQVSPLNAPRSAGNLGGASGQGSKVGREGENKHEGHPQGDSPRGGPHI